MFLFLWYSINRIVFGDEMMAKIKFYLSLLVIFGLSAILLGVSYSKEAGVSYYSSSIKVNDDLKVAYDKGNEVTIDKVIMKEDYEKAPLYNIGITNLSSEKATYVIDISCMACLSNNVYYSLDGEEPVLLTSHILFMDHINKYGKTNDFQSHSLRLFTIGDYVGKIKFNVIKIDLSNLGDLIYQDKQVYVSDNDYRYYGEDVNNYLIYQGQRYRILGLIDDRVKIVSQDNIESEYNPEDNYLTLKDFLASFNNEEVNKDNIINYSSWLKNGYYWFLDSSSLGRHYYLENDFVSDDEDSNKHFNQVVKELPRNIKVTGGKGSLEEPYEVAEVNYEGE